MSTIKLPELPVSPESVYFEGDGNDPGELVPMYSGIQMRAYAEEAVRQALAAHERRCEYCDGTGDVHSFEGEWRGVCICSVGRALAASKIDERAAFEYWASDDGETPTAVERAGHGYRLAQIQTYWVAWQARAALIPEPRDG